MNCNEVRQLLDADLDGELDLVRHLDLEAHLRSCASCAAAAEAARARRAALRELLPRFRASSELAAKVRAAIPAAPTSVAPAAMQRKPVVLFWPMLGLAASVAFATFVGFEWGSARGHANRLIDEAVADHVRSLQGTRLMDVVSTDRHTVKPWFAGKLDFSPPVVDLAEEGFSLAGARLEHLDGRPAAALVFHRRQHVINLFIWPGDEARSTPSHAERTGYHTQRWSQGGMNFLAVSEVSEKELTDFVEIFRAKT